MKRLIYIFILLSAFIYGIAVGKYHYPPYKTIKIIDDKFFKSLKPENQKKYEEFLYHKIDPKYQQTDVESLISIKSEKDIIEKRKQLIQYIWGDKGFPVSIPSVVERNIKDDRYELTNLKAIDKIIVSMDYGLNSIVYHFHPTQSNNRVVIYHQGHRGGFVYGKKTIQFFLNEGYSVVAFSLPLHGMNNRPNVYLKRFGRLELRSHDYMKFLDRPIRFFVEPVAVVLNYIAEKYNSIYMIGISGGGWTTVLYSAIDERISKSYPVAGTCPTYLAAPRDWGDYEHRVPELYQIANYLELYIMASYGRRQLQVFNRYDPACYSGIKYQTYEKHIMGNFEVYLDESHREHKISKQALKIIIKDMEK